MKENILVMLSKQFAVDIIRICTEMKEEKKGAVLVNQLLRCGTSIGANIHEGNYASSRQDFINKLQIALKECYETEYWLDIFKASEMIDEEEYQTLFSGCSKLRVLLIKSINTAKKKET